MICLVSSLFNIPISSLVKALTFLHKIMESSGYIRNYFSFHIFFSYFFKYLAKCCLQVSQSDPSLVPNALLLQVINLRLVCSLDTDVFTDLLYINWLHLSTICQVFHKIILVTSCSMENTIPQCPTYTLENTNGMLPSVCSSDVQHNMECWGCPTGYKRLINLLN